MKNSHILLLALVLFLFASCEEVYSPKPKGYFRINLPEKGYAAYESKDCPFTFEVPTYAKINYQPSSKVDVDGAECWMNIEFPSLKGKIYCSYKPVGGKEELVRMIEDAHKMTFKHTRKADYIDESTLNPSPNVQGVLYEVGGNAATNVQFFITDTATHYLRGALYFDTPPNIDSIQPVLDFVKEDILHLINTFAWKEKNG